MHAAYSVPFVTIFFFSIFIFILEIILEKLSLDQEPLTYFYVILYFVPIWILAGIFISKKKLRYLFILFIGYGMPVILTYYIYNGFTQSARENSTKTIHKRAVEYISSEIKKCNFGKSTFMNKSQNCPATAAKAVSGAVATINDKNPFNTSKKAVRKYNSNTKNEDVGYVSLSISGSNIIFRTCISKSCKKKQNRIKTIVTVK